MAIIMGASNMLLLVTLTVYLASLCGAQVNQQHGPQVSQHPNPLTNGGVHQNGNRHPGPQPAGRCANIACPHVASRPVCYKSGTEMRTFDDCAMRVEKCENPHKVWETVSTGPCPPSSSPVTRQPAATHQKHCGVCNYHSYQPVCASAGEQFKTFDGVCDINRENCENPSNKEWKFWGNGKCSGENNGQQASPVTRQPAPTHQKHCGVCNYHSYQPVCASAGEQLKTFDGVCDINRENCENPSKREWKFWGNGKCPGENNGQQPGPRQNPPPGGCPVSCGDNRAPVCGQAINGMHQTFINECHFLRDQCRDPQKEWKRANLSQCPDSHRFAQPIYNQHPQPYQPQPQWPQPTPQANCPTACATNKEPVCGSNNAGNRMFINECFMKAEECASVGQQPWRKMQLGVCSDSHKYGQTHPQPQPHPYSDCRRYACPYHVAPVCANTRDGLRAFDNECLFQVYQCENPSHYPVTRMSLDACPDAWKYQNGRHPNQHPGPVYEPGPGHYRQPVHVNEPGPGHYRQPVNEPGPSHYRQGQQCAQGCPANFQPVCGEAGNEKKTFGNSCELNLARCNNPNKAWREVHQGPCQTNPGQSGPQPARQCSNICPMNYAPLCGQAGHEKRTFSNSCNFEGTKCENPTKGWTVLHQGECPQQRSPTTPSNGQLPPQQGQQPARECGSACGMVYAPVCAQSGNEKRTFSNSCFLGIEQCNNPTKAWREVHSGRCPDNEPTNRPNQGQQHGAQPAQLHAPQPSQQHGAQPNQQPCPTQCPMNYAPVCAQSGTEKKTFSNSCTLGVAQCGSAAKDWKQIHAGECPKEETEQIPRPAPQVAQQAVAKHQQQQN